MTIFVGSKEIQNKEIFGTFKKYTYISHSKNCPEGIYSYVYCTSDRDFQRLLSFWDKQIKRSYYREMEYKYTLSLKGLEGKEISLEDIPSDQDFKVKVWLHESNVEVSYIQ